MRAELEQPSSSGHFDYILLSLQHLLSFMDLVLIVGWNCVQCKERLVGSVRRGADGPVHGGAVRPGGELQLASKHLTLMESLIDPEFTSKLSLFVTFVDALTH